MKIKIWENTSLKGTIDVGEDLESAANLMNAVKNFYDGFANKIVTSVTAVNKDNPDKIYKFMIDMD